MARVADPMAKANLLRAAREEFASAGIEAARVEDIAKRANLAKGSFYLHFKSKEEAFLQLVDQFFVSLTTMMTGKCDLVLDEVKTLEEFQSKLRGNDRVILEFCWDNRDVIRIIHESANPKYSHLLDGFLDALTMQIGANIGVLQAKGIYRTDFDPAVAASMIAGGYNQIVRAMTKSKTRPDFDALIDSILIVCTEGMARR